MNMVDVNINIIAVLTVIAYVILCILIIMIVYMIQIIIIVDISLIVILFKTTRNALYQVLVYNVIGMIIVELWNVL